jgi:hypothetical protein
MSDYREFWSQLIYGSDTIVPDSVERYWISVGIFAGVCLLIGIISVRWRIVPVIVTAIIFGAYLIAVLPFAFWTLSCTGCTSATFTDSTRSVELYFIHLAWGGFFAMGIAALWIGFLLSYAFLALTSEPERAAEPALAPEPPPDPVAQAAGLTAITPEPTVATSTQPGSVEPESSSPETVEEEQKPHATD